MRLLLDESLPWRLAHLLEGHRVESVQRAGWAGVKNGALLKLAAGAHDAFITADQNLQYQQNLGTLPLAVFVLAARSTALVDLAPLVPELLRRLAAHQARTLVRIVSPV
jgi:predicted nuclease of predicted toxin-antitoxin system